MTQDTAGLKGDGPGGGDPAKCILALTTSRGLGEDSSSTRFAILTHG